MTCKCGDPAKFICSWPVRKLHEIDVHSIRPGQFVYDRHANAALISGVEERRGVISLRLQFRNQPHPVCVVYDPTKDTILGYANSICAEPICERRVRVVGLSKQYCDYHWNTWESVA